MTDWSVTVTVVMNQLDPVALMEVLSDQAVVSLEGDYVVIAVDVTGNDDPVRAGERGWTHVSEAVQAAGMRIDRAVAIETVEWELYKRRAHQRVANELDIEPPEDQVIDLTEPAAKKTTTRKPGPAD